MPITNPTPALQPKTLVLVMTSAGVANGAAGFGITPSGKFKKIPDNNPELRRAIGAAQALAVTEGAGMNDVTEAAQAALRGAAQRLGAELQ